MTGDKAGIHSILKALGTAVATKTDHTPVILFGNDLTRPLDEHLGSLVADEPDQSDYRSTEAARSK